MALVVEDAAALARSAHRLKGALLQFCAPAALAATTEVEGMAKVGNITCVVEACAKLDTELHRLLSVLRPMLNKGQGPSA
ncbi:MAG: Hpt domain-containing protein [Nitrospiraceae bacterium]